MFEALVVSRVGAAAGWARVRDWAAAKLGETVAAHAAAADCH
jgi:hypothetical protein